MPSLTRVVLKGSLLGVLGSALAVPAALISTPLFLKGLGIRGYGYWGLLQGVFAAFNLLAVGTAEATLYFVSKDEPGDDEGRLRSRALAAVILAGCLVGGLLLVTAPWTGVARLLGLPEEELGAFERLLPAAAGFWCLQFWGTWLQLLPRARHEYGVLTASQVALTVLIPLFGWMGMTAGGGDGSLFIWGQAVAWGLACAGLLVWNAREARPLDLRPGWDREGLTQIGRYARWAFAFNLSVVALSWADRLLLAKMGTEVLAGYSVATSLTLRILGVLGLVTTTLMPAVARIREDQEPERLRAGFSVSVRAVGLLAAAMLLPLAAWGDRFLAVWLKDEALAKTTYPALLLLCVGVYYGSVASACHAALLGTGRPRLVAVTGLGGAVVGVGLAWWAIPVWGLPGAALVGLAGNAVAFALRLGFMEKIRFGRPLLPLALEQALAIAALGGAYAALRVFSPRLASVGLMGMVAVMAAAVFSVLGLGIVVDAVAARIRRRTSLFAVLHTAAKEA
jgi:O-antigen/teichoic acid export membrane protein